MHCTYLHSAACGANRRFYYCVYNHKVLVEEYNKEIKINLKFFIVTLLLIIIINRIPFPYIQIIQLPTHDIPLHKRSAMCFTHDTIYENINIYYINSKNWSGARAVQKF